jgi:hypothetical protein
MKFGVGVLYKKLSKKTEFYENQRRGGHSFLVVVKVSVGN